MEWGSGTAGHVVSAHWRAQHGKSPIRSAAEHPQILWDTEEWDGRSRVPAWISLHEKQEPQGLPKLQNHVLNGIITDVITTVPDTFPRYCLEIPFTVWVLCGWGLAQKVSINSIYQTVQERHFAGWGYEFSQLSLSKPQFMCEIQACQCFFQLP